MLLNKDTVSKIVDVVLETARKNFITDGYLDHVAIIIRKNGEIKTIQLKYKNQSEKDLAAEALRKEVKRNPTIAVIQVAEAWMNEPSKDDENRVIEAANQGKLSNQPDSFEVILGIVESKMLDEGGYEAVSRIFRNGNLKLGAWKIFPLAKEGRFVSCL